jgi:carbamoyl-phosphate synthase large subunit
VPRATSASYIESLLELCLAQRVGIVIPTIDTELISLAANVHRFRDIGVTAVISDVDLVTACRDKRQTARVFNSLGIDQPRIYDGDSIKTPCFCKPFDGSRSIGAMALLRPEALTAELMSDDKNMFMEFIGKDHKEFTIDAYYNRHGKLCCLVPRERIEVRTGEISKGATRRNGVSHYFRSKLEGLEGAIGCITIQAFANLDTGSFKALEINPRFGGGYPLAHAAGADYPDWLIREYLLHQDIGFTDQWEDNLLMLRYDAKVIVRDSAGS